MTPAQRPSGRRSSAQRARAEGSETRRAIILATEAVMLEEGYAAATSRRIAGRAGVRPALIHYYFPTMDDLFLAVLRHGAEANGERRRKAVASAQPLRALWEISTERQGIALMLEFFALANHRKAIRAELAAYAERFREAEVAVLTLLLRGRASALATLPPTAVAALMGAVSAALVMEESLEISTGHAELLAAIESFLTDLEGPALDNAAPRASLPE